MCITFLIPTIVCKLFTVEMPQSLAGLGVVLIERSYEVGLEVR